MRNTIQLVVVGFIGFVLLGAIIGSIVGIGMVLGDMKNPFKQESRQGENAPVGALGGPSIPPPKQPAPPKQLPQAPRSLLDERVGFTTVTANNKSNFKAREPAPKEVPEALMVKYPSAGNLHLRAYLSKFRPAAQRRAAVIWVHNNFGGISDQDWQQARVFHDRGFVLMCPSFRGENDNGGRFEMLYGEVDDLGKAVDFLAKNTGVDANRIYVVGHGAGGTLAMLLAATGTTKVRAFFSIGGETNIEELMKLTKDTWYAGTTPPFDYRIPGETRLRSVAPFVGSIRRNTYFVEGTKGSPNSMNVQSAIKMANESRELRINTFAVCTNAEFDHWSIVNPALEAIAHKIADDKIATLETTIRLDPADIGGQNKK